MSRRERRRKDQRGAESRTAATVEPLGEAPDHPALRFAPLVLAAAFLLPSLVTLGWGFVYDDGPIIVENPRLHALSRMGEVWTNGYWPDRSGLPLYRPLSQSAWAVLWTLSGGSPFPFHAFCLVLGTAVVLLAHRLLLSLRVDGRTAFLAALLFAVLPVHVEATASVVGSAELLAAALGLGALLAYRKGRLLLALALWILAVLSKESAAALPGLVPVLHFADGVKPFPWRRLAREGLVAATVVAGALLARHAVATGPSFIPPIDNPMALVDAGRRVLTALWIQVLYVGRSLVPAGLSADYSYKEIPLVMGLRDPRAWGGLALAGAAAWLYRYRPGARLPIALWVVPFLPAANLLFPIGTMMAERLVYLPSLGLALGLALGARRLWGRPFLAVVAVAVLGLSLATWRRNVVWRDADSFYPALVESAPGSARSWYSLGVWHAARMRDAEALAAYDRAVEIFLPYPEAWNNRGNALVALGRLEEAEESYRQALRFDAGHRGAAASLQALEAGIRFEPMRKKL